jgi:putative chitinase
MEITIDQLKKIAKNQKEEVLLKFIDPLNKMFVQFALNTNLRVCFYLANVLHECAEFKFLKEISNGIQYNNRKDLMNGPSDGPRFLGRGVLQSTGRINYQKLSDYFKVDFIKNPELLEQPQYGVLSSGFYWMNTKLNVYCDQNNFLQVCYRINGGFNGLKDRLKYLKLSFKALEVPDYDLKIKDVYNAINQNLLQPQTNHFKKSLAKSIPNQIALTELKNFIDKV